MAWTPTRAIITARPVTDNLLEYITDADRQADALTWAGGVNLKRLATIQERKANPKQPFYPNIAYSDDNDPQALGDDLNEVEYTTRFRIGVQNSNSDTAIEQARVYDKAIKSMIANCTTLTTSTNAVSAVVVGLESGFLPIQAGKNGTATNDFLQEVEMAVVVQLIGNAHA